MQVISRAFSKLLTWRVFEIVIIDFDKETSDGVGYRGDIENLLGMRQGRADKSHSDLSFLVEGLCSDVLKWTANELLESPLSDMVKKALEDDCKNVVFNALRELEDDAAFRGRLQEEQPELYDKFFGSKNEYKRGV